MATERAVAAAGGIPRFVWHPDVHAYYGETCYLYLISGYDPDGKLFHDALHDAFASSGVSSFTIYAVYGQFDAIVRVWATRDVHGQYLRDLRRTSLAIESIAEFASDDVEYTYADPNLDKVSAATIATLSTEIKVLVHAQRLYEWDEEASDAYARLLDERVITPVPPRTPGKVKFYMFFRASNHDAPLTPQQTRSQLTREATQNGGEAVTGYAGTGFCSFVLKAVASSYEETLGLVNPIRRAARPLGLSPFTLVIANYHEVREIETIDAVEIQLQPSVEMLSRLIEDVEDSSELRREIRGLPPASQAGLGTLVNEYSELLMDQKLGPIGVEILRDSVLNRRRSVHKSLSFLADIEHEARFTLTHVMPHVEPDWLARLRRIASDEVGQEAEGIFVERGAITDLAPADWSLRQILMCLKVAIREYPSVSDRVEGFLPPDWSRRIRLICVVRNDYAHGRIWERVDLRDFSGRWGERLREIFECARLYSALARANEQLGQKG